MTTKVTDVARYLGTWYELERSLSWFEPLPVGIMRGSAEYSERQAGDAKNVAFHVTNKVWGIAWHANATYVTDVHESNYEVDWYSTENGGAMLVVNPQNRHQWWFLVRKLQLWNGKQRRVTDVLNQYYLVRPDPVMALRDIFLSMQKGDGSSVHFQGKPSFKVEAAPSPGLPGLPGL